MKILKKYDLELKTLILLIISFIYSHVISAKLFSVKPVKYGMSSITVIIILYVCFYFLIKKVLNCIDYASGKIEVKNMISEKKFHRNAILMFISGIIFFTLNIFITFDFFKTFSIEIQSYIFIIAVLNGYGLVSYFQFIANQKIIKNFIFFK
ncbi:MAG: hypothetical protein WC002_06855, partial [Candidatus Muiribacteriota bacterium]